MVEVAEGMISRDLEDIFLNSIFVKAESGSVAGRILGLAGGRVKLAAGLLASVLGFPREYVHTAASAVSLLPTPGLRD